MHACTDVSVAGVRTPASGIRGMTARALGSRCHSPTTQASRWDAAQLAPAATRDSPQVEPFIGETEENCCITTRISFRGESTV